MKNWILLEAAILTLMPWVILLYSLPVLMVGVVFIVFPLDADTRALHERLFGVFPYLGGIFGLVAIWKSVFILVEKKKFPLDWQFFIAVIGGGLASWELISTANLLSFLIICMPVWFLVGHLLYLRNNIELS